MRYPIILLIGFWVAVPLFGQTSDVSRWIEQLGSEEFQEREDATDNLKKAGFRAVSELQKALKNPDVEVSERAKELLRLLEMSWLDVRDPPQIQELMLRYANAETVLDKLGVINAISDWSGNYGVRGGDGIGPLCRILRFEQEPIVRAEAAREIIAVPPVRYDLRLKWFETVQKSVTEPGDDFLLLLAVQFAEAYELAMEYRGKSLFEENPQPAGEKLLQAVRSLTKRINVFRETPEYYEGRRGTDTDILLFYAIAELQDAVGLKEELDETLFQALDVHPIISDEVHSIHTDERHGSLYMPHCMAADYLASRSLHAWAKNEYLMVAKRDNRMKSIVTLRGAEQANYLEENELAAELFGIVAEAIADQRNPANDFFSGDPNFVKAQHKMFLAKLAVNRGEIVEAKKLLDEAVQLRPNEVDCLILRYEIGNDDEEYKKKTDELIAKVLANAKREMQGKVHLREQVEYYAQPFNQAAWLLANTGGDYELALNSAKKAVEFSPNSPNILDTLAHVYALGKEYDKAVETQKNVVRYAPQATVFRSALKKFETQAAANKTVK